MKNFLWIGGPLVLFTWFALHSDLVTYGSQHPGLIHLGGVEQGGTYALVHEETYQCDENGNNCVLVDEKTEVGEVQDGSLPAGVSASPNYRLEEQSTGFGEVGDLQFEEQPIEYRDGLSAEYNKTKQPGLTKYANISIKRPSGFNWGKLKFTFDTESALDGARREVKE